MDASTLQAKVYGGYAKAAARIGLPFAQYRPASALSAAIAPGNLLRTLLAGFNAEDMRFARPRGYAKALWYVVGDGSLLAPGDYLAGNGRTFFVAAMQPLLPIVAVECNRVVSVAWPARQGGVGAAGYGGDTVPAETPMLVQFPASILQGTKGEQSLVGLPGDARSPWWAVLLPPLPGEVVLRSDLVLRDDLGRRYVVSSAEETALGWRLSAMEAGT